MLTEEEVESLLKMTKILADQKKVNFPLPGDVLQLDAVGEGGRERFIFDVNRKGRIKISKCTYQNRVAVVEVLLRFDIDGPPHTNPDGEEIPCPHLHIYREGYGDKWAIAAPADFTNTNNLSIALIEFLRYCKVENIPEVQGSLTNGN